MSVVKYGFTQDFLCTPYGRGKQAVEITHCSRVKHPTALCYCYLDSIIKFITYILKYIPVTESATRFHNNLDRYKLDILCAYIKHHNT